MNADTLVLNPDQMPLSILPLSTMTWEEAISAVYKGLVDVVYNYETWVVHSPSVVMHVPAVVRKREFVSMGRRLKFCKANVYLRDRYTCQYCGHRFAVRDLTWDHVVPRARGGKSRWDNVATACENCNFDKGHGSLMQPRVAPYAPNYFELVAKKKAEVLEIPHAKWNEYLQWPEDKLKLTRKAA